MKTLTSLTISIETIDGKLTATCDEAGSVVESDSLNELIGKIEDNVYDYLFQTHETGNLLVNDFVKKLIGSGDWESDENAWETWLDEERWNRHTARLEAAFFSAYPKAAGGMMKHLNLPYHDWDDETWDQAKTKAEVGLIQNGATDQAWIGYCRAIAATKYFEFNQQQRDKWYRDQLEWGLPLRPIAEIKQMYSQHGIEIFANDLVS